MQLECTMPSLGPASLTGKGAHDFAVVAWQVFKEAYSVVPEFFVGGIKISPGRVWMERLDN